jgi:glycosyltransferase involved in cell wall biosynthesis
MLRPPWPILLLVRELNLGGCERDLTKLAIGLDRSVFEPHVAFFQPQGIRRGELEAAGVPLLHLPVPSFLSTAPLKGGLMLLDYLRRHSIRLVQSFDVPLSIFTPPWARLAGVPAVINSQLSYRTLVSPGRRRLLRMNDRLCHRVVVNCKAMWRHLATDESVPEEKLFLSYNGIDTAVFHPGPRVVPPGFRSADLVIGCISALRPEKRIDLLIRSFAEVLAMAPEVKLLIAGSGPELPRLEALANELGVASRVVFQPATQDVPYWLHAIDIFVLASESEAFSNALLEAMACGCCAVGSAVGGTPELIEDGVSGLLFPAGDQAALTSHLLTLARQPEQRHRLAAAAMRHAARNLSMEAAIHRMSGFYSELLSTHAA